jgi:hypothetical protein
MKRLIILTLTFLASLPVLRAQQYLGTPGLIHVPSAEMDTACVARIGAHYVDQHMVPDGLKCDGKKFNTATNYLSITPFSWIEIGYGYTLWKLHRNLNEKNPTGFYSKDRYFTVRLRPLPEGKYWPAVVIGGNDVWGSSDDGKSGSNFYRNYYVAASKHVELGGNLIGAHMAYRKWKRDYNAKWDGVVGGLTFQPAFYQKLRVIGEYDGDGINAGVDCEVFRFFLLQASLQQGKYFSAGLCFRMGLL